MTDSHLDEVGRFRHKPGVPTDHVSVSLHDVFAHEAINLLAEAYLSEDPQLGRDLSARLRAIQSGPGTHGGFDTRMLYCPECGKTHRDVEEWAKILHHTHVCLYCGHMWKLFNYVFGSLKDITDEELNYAHTQNLVVQVHGVRAIREQFLKDEGIQP